MLDSADIDGSATPARQPAAAILGRSPSAHVTFRDALRARSRESWNIHMQLMICCADAI